MNPPMKRQPTTATLRFPGGRLVLPLAGAYDAEVAVDHVHAAARRHGEVELRVGEHVCIVRIGRSSTEQSCGHCGGFLGEAEFAHHDGVRCDACAAGGLLARNDRRRRPAA